MAKVSYLLQGMKKEDNHQDHVIDILKENHDKVIIYSAFIKERSIEDIEEELMNNRGKITALIGIRNGITTMQGIKCLHDAGVDIYLIDTGSNTQIFHPKTLVAIDEVNKKAHVMIGSANFTPGGLLNNIENSAFFELDLTDKDDKAFLDTFLANFTDLTTKYSADNVIHVDNKSVIDDLLAEGRIVDETTTPKVTTVGKSGGKKPGVKKMPIRVGRHHKKKSAPVTTSTRGVAVIGGTFSGSITEVWRSKPLNERDLTIPSASGTNPTGSMLMKKGDYEVDQQTYFRDTVFAGLSWAAKAGKPTHFEYANAKFHFVIDGIDNGEFELTLKYDSRTDTASYLQRQPNVHLSWGDAKDIIKNRNLIGQIMRMYKVDGTSDEFVIDIAAPDSDEA